MLLNGKYKYVKNISEQKLETTYSKFNQIQGNGFFYLQGSYDMELEKKMFVGKGFRRFDYFHRR